jgi:hypothetical protein
VRDRRKKKEKKKEEQGIESGFYRRCAALSASWFAFSRNHLAFYFD